MVNGANASQFLKGEFVRPLPVPEGRNVYRGAITKPNKPQRGVMFGRAHPIAQIEPGVPQNISPRWGWHRHEALNYKHCVPTGLKTAPSWLGQCVNKTRDASESLKNFKLNFAPNVEEA